MHIPEGTEENFTKIVNIQCPNFKLMLDTHKYKLNMSLLELLYHNVDNSSVI
jgi:hypothetical protein